MLNWALKYLNLGYCIIPLRPKSKEPLIPWREYQTKKSTEQEIKNWWQSYPMANIGIVTGKVSGIAVVDLDGPEGIKSGSSLKLVSTVTVRTGNGKQLYYSDPEGLCRNSVKKIPGVDIRGEGGYVVAPPSLHPNGSKYSFLTPVLGVTKLPVFPMNIFADSVSMMDTTIVSVVKEESWIAKALEEMKDGNIDETLFRICSRLRNDGYSELDAKVLLQPHAERVGAISGHLEEKIKNVWSRYEPRVSMHSGVEIQRTGPGLYGNQSALTIHSPTNPDSVEQYTSAMASTNRTAEFPTGYSLFDRLTGGLRRSEILTVAARTGVGKTNWLIGPARTLCEQGKKVLLFSTEMSFDQIWSRYRATLDDPESFAKHQFYICDEFAPNTERIEEALKLIQPDVFIFDHINNVGDEQQKLSEFMKGLKFLARKFNIPGIIAAQLNRSADWVENGERVAPRLSMIKGAGTIEEVSAQVLLLSETRVILEGTEIVGIVDKNRWGEKGQLNFILRKQPWRIEEIK